MRERRWSPIREKGFFSSRKTLYPKSVKTLAPNSLHSSGFSTCPNGARRCEHFVRVDAMLCSGLNYSKGLHDVLTLGPAMQYTAHWILQYFALSSTNPLWGIIRRFEHIKNGIAIFVFGPWLSVSRLGSIPADSRRRDDVITRLADRKTVPVQSSDLSSLFFERSQAPYTSYDRLKKRQFTFISQKISQFWHVIWKWT